MRYAMKNFVDSFKLYYDAKEYTFKNCGSLADLPQNETDLNKPGVYIFFRKFQNAMIPVYVGESTDVITRLNQHLDLFRKRKSTIWKSNSPEELEIHMKTDPNNIHE
jgi:hypothetical protein